MQSFGRTWPMGDYLTQDALEVAREQGSLKVGSLEGLSIFQFQMKTFSLSGHCY